MQYEHYPTICVWTENLSYNLGKFYKNCDQKNNDKEMIYWMYMILIKFLNRLRKSMSVPWVHEQ